MRTTLNIWPVNKPLSFTLFYRFELNLFRCKKKYAAKQILGSTLDVFCCRFVSINDKLVRKICWNFCKNIRFRLIFQPKVSFVTSYGHIHKIKVILKKIIRIYGTFNSNVYFWPNSSSKTSLVDRKKFQKIEFTTLELCVVHIYKRIKNDFEACSKTSSNGCGCVHELLCVVVVLVFFSRAIQ